jgi:hypothetical protein
VLNTLIVLIMLATILLKLKTDRIQKKTIELQNKAIELQKEIIDRQDRVILLYQILLSKKDFSSNIDINPDALKLALYLTLGPIDANDTNGIRLIEEAIVEIRKYN